MPAVGLARRRVQALERIGQGSPHRAGEAPVAGHRFHDEEILVDAHHLRRRRAGRADRRQHRGLGARGRGGFGDEAAAVGEGERRHLGEIAAGEPARSDEPAAGECRGARGDIGHVDVCFDASRATSARAAASTSRQVVSKPSSGP